jgi:2-C-methyl-D-erythritol 2,4-cyclodiphosphate synthase
VNIPFEKGLKGHSDADVLLHSICDAILGAAGLGDIGEHFPDTDPLFKGISSLALLEKCGQLLLGQGYRISNIDATIISQAPKVGPYKKRMKENIASTLNIKARVVNIKATTTENLGFIGREEGIAAHSTILVSVV